MLAAEANASLPAQTQFSASAHEVISLCAEGLPPRRERAGDQARAAAASLQGRLGADSFQRAVQQAESDFADQLQDLLCGEITPRCCGE